MLNLQDWYKVQPRGRRSDQRLCKGTLQWKRWPYLNPRGENILNRIKTNQWILYCKRLIGSPEDVSVD